MMRTVFPFIVRPNWPANHLSKSTLTILDGYREFNTAAVAQAPLPGWEMACPPQYSHSWHHDDLSCASLQFMLEPGLS